ncbi:hypothetical protein BMS3Bbin14_01640 [bacterium BMS3Bbin14]|nr:hypothetical protein BMS3Bbin14_01640 [bacterium BMS3Bbin14]
MKIQIFDILALSIITATMLSLSGCAGGRSYDYRAISIDPMLSGNNTKLAIGVHDEREYVKNGDKYPQYVGTQRSPAYVPWNINTKSGLPMAEDFLKNIGKSLQHDGYKVDLVLLPEKENKKQVLARLQDTGDNKLLLFTINEWYFDVWYKTRMEYSMKLEVFDNNLRLLAHSEVAKKMWGENDNAVPDLEFKSAVEKLLSNDSIVKSLGEDFTYSDTDAKSTTYQSNTIKSERVDKDEKKSQIKQNKIHNENFSKPIANKCSTEQILKMKEMRMSDEQIKAACQ